ncbi:MAG: ABC transporter ATP-binding protein [Actinobacteria bacterium]|nr:ABC transporter ATP-binding protein [Actinomycetota bacterium]
MPEALLEVKDLRVNFGGGRDVFLRRKEHFEAVRGVDLTIRKGESFAIVGESGAGKSTVAKCIVGLRRPTAGEILFAGEPLRVEKDSAQRRAIQMVFQDPYGSLNPRMTVSGAIGELLRVNGLAADKAAAQVRTAELLEMVGLPRTAMKKRPRAFSGGQRQRIGIARALAIEPTLLVADEPVSALDVSIQASILILLKRLQRELGLTMVFISHDLAVVKQLCDRVAVMNDGVVVEEGSVGEVLAHPKDPYTQKLLDATTELPPMEIARLGAVGASRGETAG